jgi:hypothetical protein
LDFRRLCRHLSPTWLDGGTGFSQALARAEKVKAQAKVNHWFFDVE